MNALSTHLATDYTELTGHLRRVNTLESVLDLLGWDEQVNLPIAAAERRGEQMSAMAEVAHAEVSSARAGELISGLSAAGDKLDASQRSVVAQARREYDRATRLPADFIRAKAVQSSRGYHAWTAARAADNFTAYVPVLEKNLEFAKQEAAYLGRSADAYDCFLDIYDPGLTEAAIRPIFAELKRELVPLMRSITASKVKGNSEQLKGFPVDIQAAFVREVSGRIGFDYRRGRLDVSVHPFCSGAGDDVRMTTRFKSDSPLEALFGAIHESGHGLYEQGLPVAHRGTALGMHAGMAVHESQSRLWENQVGRSRGFWKFFEPRLRRLFPTQTALVSSDELYLAINEVAPTPIRTESDEVTYNLHIILRFEIECRLFDGSLAVEDLPEAWKGLSKELLGIEPSTNREGVLQDVHWSGGAFGYFPSYCLGNLIAAQLWYKALDIRPELEEDFACGNFAWLLGWLRKNVHSQGRRMSALELTKVVTGQELSPRPFLRYLKERYGSLYL